MKTPMVGVLAMADGFNELQGWIAKLRELGESPEDIAEDIAPELRDEFEKNIAASRAPDGTPWKATQAGTPPLKNAAKALGVAAIGKKVVAVLQGIEARHHAGTVRGKIARPILPTKDIPEPIVKLIIRVAEKRFNLIMGGS